MNLRPRKIGHWERRLRLKVGQCLSWTIDVLGDLKHFVDYHVRQEIWQEWLCFQQAAQHMTKVFYSPLYTTEDLVSPGNPTLYTSRPGRPLTIDPKNL